MSNGELVYLALTLGCFTIFALVVVWLRADYVKHRRSTVDRLRVHAAE